MGVETQSKRYRPWLCLAPCLRTYSEVIIISTTHTLEPLTQVDHMYVLQFHVRHCTVLYACVCGCGCGCVSHAPSISGVQNAAPCPVPVPRHHADHAELILLPASISCGAVGTCPARTPKAGWGAVRKGTRLWLDERDGTKDRLAVDTAQMGLAFYKEMLGTFH